MNKLIFTLAAMVISVSSFAQTDFLTEKKSMKQLRKFENRLHSVFIGFDTTRVAADYFRGATANKTYHPVKFKRTNDDFFPELSVRYYYDENTPDSTIVCAAYDWDIMNYVKNLNDDGHYFDTEIKRENEYLQKYNEIKATLIEKFGEPQQTDESKNSNGYFYRLNWENSDADISVVFQFSTRLKNIGVWKVGSYSIRVKFDYK